MSYMVFDQITDLTNIGVYITVKDTLLIMASINATCFGPQAPFLLSFFFRSSPRIITYVLNHLF